jgi:hypothetical protein
MYKYFFLIIALSIIWKCSSSDKLPAIIETAYYEPPSYYEQETIDSINIVASIQPIDYPWNTEGHLVDILNKYDVNSPFINPFSILLSFENIKPDTFTIYFCLIRSDRCVEIDKKYFNGGLYSIGFQKLNVETGWYDIKFISSDAVYSNTYMIAP